MADAAGRAVKERTLFGHPIGLSYLFTTEMWERFSYYGMRAILIYSLVNYLLLQPTSDSVVGYHALKHFFELIYNGGQPLAPQPLSSLIYGNYTSFVYLTPIIGGMIADRWIGQRNSVIIGAVIMAAGEFTLMVPQLFFLGLLLLIIGNGFFKPNISTQVGNLYKPGDHRIDSAFSIFYVGINLGAFFSPLICGTLGEAYGYHWGYFAAGAGMVLGLISYLFALRTLPEDRAGRLKKKTEVKTPMTGEDWKATIALFLLFIPGSLFWAAYEQQGNTIALFAQNLTDRRLIPGLVNWEIPYTWFQSFNPAFIMLFTPLVVGFWSWQSKRGKEPSVLTKMALGNIMMGLSYVVMIGAVSFTGAHEQVSWLWLLAFFAVITMGELYFSPIGLALTARVAPPQILSMMMGVWLMTSFVGNQLQGFLGKYFSIVSKQEFFLMCAGVGLFAGIVFWLFNFPLRGILESRANRHKEKPAG
ncbi:MAG: peptide MFS transporter [Alphaproteobacteria bacterium]|nr:peptide MFS transporter [Alphaproteobacteria bacterium]